MGRRIQLLPNLITLGNAFCGLLALAKAIDALTQSTEDPIVFYQKMETACFLVFLLGSFYGMIHVGLLAALAALVAFAADILVAPALLVLATRRPG